MGKANLDIRVNDLLGITGGTGNVAQEIIDPKPISKAVIPMSNVEDMDSDYKYSRENFYNLIKNKDKSIINLIIFEVVNKIQIKSALISVFSKHIFFEKTNNTFVKTNTRFSVSVRDDRGDGQGHRQERVRATPLRKTQSSEKP